MDAWTNIKHTSSYRPVASVEMLELDFHAIRDRLPACVRMGVMWEQ